jgi:hypothetical protein
LVVGVPYRHRCFAAPRRIRRRALGHARGRRRDRNWRRRVARPRHPAGQRHDACAPLDSASGTIAPADVARIFALIESEGIFSLRDINAACPDCADEVSYATTVQANGRRKVVTSDGETNPKLLGRLHVGLAEAIRAARDAT